MNARLLPLAGFILVFALLGFGIYWSQRHDPREVPSPFKGEAGRGMVFAAATSSPNPSPPNPPLEGEG